MTTPTPEPALELTITDVAYRGSGIARHEGWVVFVRGALIGERIRARIVKRKKQYGEAVIEEILTPSPQRETPACSLAGTCPGCAYQHVIYAEEVRLKQAQLMQFLRRAAAVPPERFATPIASPQPLHYRNKIVLHADTPAGGEPVLGYFAADNTSILDIPACPLAQEPINARLAELRVDPEFRKTLRADLAVTLRATSTDGVMHWSGRLSPNAPDIREQTRLGELTVPRGSFFQVNPGAADLLLEKAEAWIRDCAPRAVVDLYCGVGVFGLAAARAGVAQVLGIDSDPNAIRAATQNAASLGVSGATTFHAGAAEDDVRAALRRFPADDTLLIVDPPRTGLAPAIVSTVIKARPAAMLYISCAADTLARDLAPLVKAGYVVEAVQLVDMFPRTAYFETLVLLKRG